MTETTPGYRAIANSLTAKDGGYTTQIPDGWKQGRTAYGGLTTALCLRAIEKDFPDLPPLRTMQIAFSGPITENPIIKTELLRAGRNVTSIRASVYQGDAICGSASFMFGSSRSSVVKATKDAKDTPAPEDCEWFIPKFAHSMVPVFFLRFYTKLIDGYRPMTGADKGYTRCWSQHADEASREGTDSFLALGDVLPPAAMGMAREMGPISSMNWQVNILVDDLTSEEGWWQVETQQTAAQDGYSSQIMRYWNKDGVLVAEGLQSVALFI